MRALRVLLIAILLMPTLPAGEPSQPTALVTVSGTVTGPGGAGVPNVWIGVNSLVDWKETTTNASGFYSVSIQNSGQLVIHVRPAVSTRLTQINHRIDSVTGNVTQNFTVTNGYLISVRLTGSGTPYAGPAWFDTQPLQNVLPDNRWYQLEWDDVSQHFQAVLPGDIYWLTAHPAASSGYYDTLTAFDLRSSDRIQDMPLNTTFVHPIPYDPPDATKIVIGAPDDLGEATVTGSAGAALPLARVVLINLNSTHQASAVSSTDGSFTARIYAPPGSSIMVKHGPASGRWNDLAVGLSEQANPFPGTIINVPHTHTAPLGSLPFAAAGVVSGLIDDPNTTRNYVGAAWAMTGTVGPVVIDGAWTRILTGTYNSNTMPGLYLGGLNWTHPALVNLDADGDLDLVVGERSGALVMYRNVGSAASPNWRFENANYAGVNTGNWAYPTFADVTNDGQPDLFVGTGSGSVSIYDYNGGWPAQPDASLTAGNSAAPALDDLDGDGDLDLLIGYDAGHLYHFKNTGTLTNPIWTQQTATYASISESSGVHPAFIDLDGDSDQDLLIGLQGSLIWYRRGGTPATPTWTRVASDPIGYGGGSSATSPGIGDWDGDGDKDVVTGEHWGNLRFFRQSAGPAWSEAGFEFPFDLAGEAAPALADWDNDGDLDLLIGQVHGNVEQYTNIGSVSNPNWRPDGVLLTLPWTNHPHAFPALADIDGDNDEDLFVGEGGWQGPNAGGNIHFYQNTGTSTSPAWTLVVTNYLGLDVGGWSTPAFVDIDADNDLDLFVGDEAGTLTFVENISPTWAAPVQPYADIDVGDYSAPSFFDVDGDTDLDMLIGSLNGSLAYVRNTGTRFVPVWELVATQYPGIDIGERSVPTAADITGDGQRDLLIGDIDGGLNIFRYDGPGSPPPPGSAYAPGDLFQIEGKVRLHSPAITSTTNVGDISINAHLHMLMLYNAQGDPLAAENYFFSTQLAPGGFPIQLPGRSSLDLHTQTSVDNLHYVSGHTIEGDLTLTAQVPVDFPPGAYRPGLFFDFTSVPTSTDWLAANVTFHTFYPNEAALPPIVVDDGSATLNTNSLRLYWQLLMDDFVQGTRGTLAREDRGKFAIASQIVSQDAHYITPPIDEHTGQPITYRLEPYLPIISYTDRRMPTPPLIPFDLPGGSLHVTLREPDGTLTDLGSEAFAQSFNRTKTTRSGDNLNNGTVQLDDVYSLKAASNRFRVAFDQYGHHVITMTGTISDVWGNGYAGGGAYDVWIAHPLDIDPDVLPGTPFAASDAINPAMRLHPNVPADVTLTVVLYPDSDPAQAITRTIAGRANAYGYFSSASAPITMTRPGEYRIDITAAYTEASGKLYRGALAWGGVVMTPDVQSDLIAHGRRGLDSLTSIPNHWFVASRDLTIPPGAISHSLNPYYNGDILWSRMSDSAYGGDSLVLGASVQDTIGTIETAIQTRAARMGTPLAAPGDLSERVAKGELPLFTSTRSGRPARIEPDDVDQIAYSYRVSQRPGVRVREVVAEDGQSGGYWRLDTLYDDQLSVGIQGDLPNDFKFQYVGTVYRDLDTGHAEYGGQGSGWVFIPDSDTTGSRVMPPFSGAGNGGWTQEGGPILTLKGKAIDMFILPTGTPPGAVLQVSDTFHFAGHLMPTLDSRVLVTVTAPSGAKHVGGGQANSIGYFYDPLDVFRVNEAGLWSVDVRVWHDGQIGTGDQADCDPGDPFDPVKPCPSGDVLGSESGRYWFYVVPIGTPRLTVSSPAPGLLAFDYPMQPITITGATPAGLTGVTIDYTIGMPGYILKHGQVTPSGNQYQIVFDPVALQQDFPNLDLNGRDNWNTGLSDTFSIGVLLRGQSGGQTIYRANTITLQGNQVFIGEAPTDLPNKVFLPLISKGG